MVSLALAEGLIQCLEGGSREAVPPYSTGTSSVLLFPRDKTTLRKLWSLKLLSSH